ncbi:helix-turn-helix domain-containing protein [Enterobacteriaceae bacterium DFI.7.85]|nr:helix-turn-helix domain-containing protein [Enterobacteriaceae bacterium DFI.7.85]
MYVASTKSPRTFVKAYHDVLKSPDLNPTDKLVYLTLLSYQEAGLQVFPSNEHIAESLSISKDSVIRATSKLVKLGAIEKTRRFNKSNLVTVHSLEVADCNVQRSQNATSRGSKVQLYKNTDNNKNKISKEEGQNQDASLSQVNMGLDETRIHCDKSVSDLNLDEEIAEDKSVKREELVTQTYASMPSTQDDFDDEPLDHSDDYSDDSFTASQDDFDDEPLEHDDDVKVPNQNIFATGNRIGMAPHQLKRQKQLNCNNHAF